jgi:hypothetical protein
MPHLLLFDPLLGEKALGKVQVQGLVRRAVERRGEQREQREQMADMDEEEQLRESIKNHPHLTLDELREFKELFNLVSQQLLRTPPARHTAAPLP